jgi:hypothetical protein
MKVRRNLTRFESNKMIVKYKYYQRYWIKHIKKNCINNEFD